MADFKFSCSHCDQHLKVDERLSGRQIQCPGCNHLINIPPAPWAQMPSPDESGNTWNTFIVRGKEKDKTEVPPGKKSPKKSG